MPICPWPLVYKHTNLQRYFTHYIPYDAKKGANLTFALVLAFHIVFIWSENQKLTVLGDNGGCTVAPLSLGAVGLVCRD